MAECPECGARTGLARDHELLQNRTSVLRRSFHTNIARSAVEVADLRLRLMEYEQSESFMQRKVHRQAVVIKRLEERLIAAGKRPYEQPVRPPIIVDLEIEPPKPPRGKVKKGKK